MDAWVIWLIAAVVFAVGEIATLGFFLAPFALGAALAAGIAAVTVFGWDELESRFLDTVTAPVWTGLGGLP